MYLMIDNYDSFTYNLYALFRECGAEMKIIKNSEFIPADEFQGIVISPGPSSPEHSGTSMKYLELYRGKKPIFGVCLGMQCIARSMGYPVIQAATIKHGKIDMIEPNGESVLYRQVPQSFRAVRYHSLAVDIDERYVTARAKSDGTVMSIEDRENMLFGVQYHPESVLSEEGKRIVMNFIDFASTHKAVSADELVQSANRGGPLAYSDACSLFDAMLTGRLTDAQIASVLISLRTRGETPDEVAALVATMNRYKRPFIADRENLVDTCGTGGDGKSTVNISTAVSIILASMGYQIVKHGNAAQSGKVGSADILSELGFDLDYKSTSPEEFFKRHNFVFIFAPQYHPALKQIGKIRREIKVPTIFNYVGPLANPADPDFQVIGISSRERLDLIAGAIQKIGRKNITVYSSDDGYDEVSSRGTTECRFIQVEKTETFYIDPSEFFEPFDMPVVKDREDAKRLFMDGLFGTDERIAELFSLNTALALKTMNVSDLREGYLSVKEHLMKGIAGEKLNSLVSRELQ